MPNNSKWKDFKKQWQLQLMTLPGILFLLIFAYIPMFGLVIVFQKFSPGKGFFKSEWVGILNFIKLFSDPTFFKAAWNTIAINLWKVLLGFPAPIVLALLINEIPFKKFKKTVQTSSYLPHFISFVVAASMWTSFLSSAGIVNKLLMAMNLIDSPLGFWSDPWYFRGLVTVMDIWKGAGWGSIIYLAAIAGINEEIYEAATIDGAGRMRKIISITLPSMVGIISIMFILGIGGMVRGSLDVSYLLGNAFNRDVSYMLEYYTLDLGLILRRYSFATTVGLVQSLFALTLVLITNRASGKLSGRRLF